MQSSLWKPAIATPAQYSQLTLPQAVYLQAALLGRAPGLNSFAPWIRDGGSYDLLFKTLQAMGVRYVVSREALDAAVQRKFAERVWGVWRLYELPHPNVSGYSPANAILAETAPDAVSVMRRDDFDFRRDVVVATSPGALAPARDTVLTIRLCGGFHVTGRSDGTALLVLPLQFSHCLKAHDPGVRIVRADIMWAGIVFSNTIDTDITFDYGIFSPRCRRADLADVKRLGMTLTRSNARPE